MSKKCRHPSGARYSYRACLYWWLNEWVYSRWLKKGHKITRNAAAGRCAAFSLLYDCWHWSWDYWWALVATSIVHHTLEQAQPTNGHDKVTLINQFLLSAFQLLVSWFIHVTRDRAFSYCQSSLALTKEMISFIVNLISCEWIRDPSHFNAESFNDYCWGI